jgi:3-deoxy-manno-octulosonate cytidylyltransferase (CMP-KDO synthetase)
MMFTVAIIPARFASERLPGKPLADIAGRPMIQHVYERTARTPSISRVIVATDDERVAEAVRKFRGEVAMTPPGIKSGSDRIAYVARSLTGADIVVNVQGDEPLVVPEMLEEAIAPLLQDASLQVATLVRRITSPGELDSPSVPKVLLDVQGNCLYFSRAAVPYARDLPRTEWVRAGSFYKHIGVYVYRREFLLTFAALPQTPLELLEKLEQLRILEHGYRMKGTITLHDTTPVDTAADLEKVRNILAGTS